MKKIYLSLLCSASIFANAHAGFQENDFEHPSKGNIQRIASLLEAKNNTPAFRAAINVVRTNLPQQAIIGIDAQRILDVVSKNIGNQALWDEKNLKGQLPDNIWKCMITNWITIYNAQFINTVPQNSQQKLLGNQQPNLNQNFNNQPQWNQQQPHQWNTQANNHVRQSVCDANALINAINSDHECKAPQDQLRANPTQIIKNAVASAASIEDLKNILSQNQTKNFGKDGLLLGRHVRAAIRYINSLQAPQPQWNQPQPQYQNQPQVNLNNNSQPAPVVSKQLPNPHNLLRHPDYLNITSNLNADRTTREASNSARLQNVQDNNNIFGQYWNILGIDNAIKSSYILDASQKDNGQRANFNTQYEFVDETTDAGIMGLSKLGLKMGVADAANANHLGGGFQNGKGYAQEEALMHASTLYPIMCELFKGQKYNLYNGRIAVLEECRIIKKRNDHDWGFKRELKGATFTTIAQAAHNVKDMIPGTQQAMQAEKDTKSYVEHQIRAAKNAGCEVLVLTAFGVGSFVYDSKKYPQDAARYRQEMAAEYARVLNLPEFKNAFHTVRFSNVNTETNKIFAQAFGKVFGNSVKTAHVN